MKIRARLAFLLALVAALLSCSPPSSAPEPQRIGAGGITYPPIPTNPLTIRNTGLNVIEGTTDQEQLKILTVDGAAVDLVTLRMKHPATVTGAAGTFNPSNGDTATLGIDVAADFVTTFASTDNTVDLCIAKINAAAGRTFATKVGGQIKLTSVEQDTRGQVRVTSGSSGLLTKLGLTAATTPGTNTVISDLTSTGAIEANAISFQNGLQQAGGGGIVGEFAGGALVVTSGPQGNGNQIFSPSATGTFYVAPGQNVAITNALQLGYIASGGGKQGIQIPNGQALYGVNHLGVGPYEVVKIVSDDTTAIASAGGGVKFWSAGFGVNTGLISEVGALTMTKGVGEYGVTAPGSQPTRVGQLTDNSGGSATGTIAAITAGAGYTQADMLAAKNAIASLTAKVNALELIMHNKGETQ